VSLRATIAAVSGRLLILVAGYVVSWLPAILLGNSGWTLAGHYVALVGVLTALFFYIRSPSNQAPWLLTGDEQLGLWRFRAVSGRFAGDGMFPRILLEPDEVLEQSVWGTLYRRPWSYILGYLCLTDRRLLISGRSFLFRQRSLSLPFSAITSLSVKRYAPLFFRRVLVVTQADGSRLFSTPADVSQLAESIASGRKAPLPETASS
jgi:hypothetical protein